MTGGTVALASPAADAARQLEELVRGAVSPIGLIAVNGLVLLRLVEALGETDLSATDALRIATFDEYAWNRALFGGITTAVQDTAGLATAALDALLDGRGTDGPARTAVVPGRVIVRASTRGN